MSRKGRAKAQAIDAVGKQPKTAVAAPESTAGDHPYFCFKHADRATGKAWKFAPTPEEAPSLMTFMCDMACLSWREIEDQKTGQSHARHKKHHAQSVESLSADARKDLKRLAAIFGDEDIFRFRLSGERRLWGFRRGRVFHAVFWDPQHEVYPTERS